MNSNTDTGRTGRQAQGNRNSNGNSNRSHHGRIQTNNNPGRNESTRSANTRPIDSRNAKGRINDRGERNNQGRRENNEGRGRGRGRNNNNDNSHSRHNSNQSTGNTISQAETSDGVQSFWKNLSQRVQNNNDGIPPFDIYSIDDKKMWYQSWEAASAGANKSDIRLFRTLLKVLLRLPQVPESLPSSDLVIAVINHYISYEISPMDLQDIIDIVHKRLCAGIQNIRKSINIADLIDNVMKLKNEFQKSCIRLMGTTTHDQVQRIAVSLTNVIYFDNYKQLLLQHQNQLPLDNEVDDDDKEMIPWLQWRDKPTLRWLMNDSWHDVIPLSSHYDDADHYAETLLRIWVLLAFYWGAGALFPKCRHKKDGDDTSCGEPLLFQAGRNICSQRNCNNLAMWKCHSNRHGHDALCKSCFMRQQEAIIGVPSPNASTDIYDAVVDREQVRREGMIYNLSKLTSRKPPRIEPNWRTSYRLKSSGLVAIMKLGASNVALDKDAPIQWAEIVPVDIRKGYDGDFEFRQQQKIALRLLGRADCPSFPSHADSPIDLGTRVAIIDLRVFVPEVVSVLSIFARESFASNLKEIPFVNKLIGISDNDPLPAINFNSTPRDIITAAIYSSQIEILKSRLRDIEKQEVVTRICALQQVKTLYGTQLEAFAHGIIGDVHCTQGPPGTGKSFVGVALVHAFVIIRSVANKAGHSLGPVLMLSYKNHALDEFLVDVLKFSPKPLTSGQLIRSGNPENEKLRNYTEKTSSHEKDSEKELIHRIKTLRECERIASQWRTIANTLETNALVNENRNALDFQIIVNIVQALVCCHEINCYANEIQNVSATAYQFAECTSSITSIGLVNTGKDQVDDSVPQLMDQMEYWQVKPDFAHEIKDAYVRRLTFYLYNWIHGSQPPPRCNFKSNNGQQCTLEAEERFNYCINHRCSFDKMKCPNERYDESLLFCDVHRCQSTSTLMDGNCRLSIQFQNSRYCQNHSCVSCFETNSFPISEVKNPTEGCLIHQCNHESSQKQKCPTLKLLPHSFCQQHLCVTCLNTVEVVDWPIVNQAYCGTHACAFQGCQSFAFRPNDVFKNNIYCSKHACVVCLENRLNHPHSIEANSKLCQMHRCQYPHEICLSRKLNGEGHLFCSMHSCRIGITLNQPCLTPSVDKFPLNTCSLHKLCGFMNNNGELCSMLTKHGEVYCNFHFDFYDKIKGDGKCAGFVDNIRCKVEGKSDDDGIWYCEDHITQKKNELEIEDMFHEHLEPPVNNPLPEINIPDNIQKVRDIQRCCDPTNLCTNSRIKLARNTSRWMCALHRPDFVLKVQKLDPLPIAVEPKHISMPEINHVSTKAKKKIINERIESEKLETIELKHQPFEKENVIEDNFVDKDEVYLDPDEQDVASDYEGEINDDIQRLLDIGGDYDVDSDDIDSDMEDDTNHESLFNNGVFHDEDDIETCVALVMTWNWNMKVSDRLNAVARMLRGSSSSLMKLRGYSEAYLTEARTKRSQIAAQSYKKAKIIGATVVGASKRLEAIRAAEPFAIVVEEACEVMEPTLMSVLTVKSLRKLELIGDHRQLPASVQQCWYALESSQPSIKTSLFERLIEGSVATLRQRGQASATARGNVSKVPSTILDEQRRMRETIADLTRSHYDDIVTITDHPHTARQQVGDKCTVTESKLLERNRILWRTKGRSIPGVPTAIYFWDLKDSKDGRASVGLSACNLKEVEAVVGLTSYLLQCGVPKTSISIITPYKGQKLEIIKALRKSKCLPSFNRNDSNNNNNEDSIIVSTVDRYQGDENDIVILSLVRTQPGNQFVALLNRFIVAVSRARLGSFIIGSRVAVSQYRGNANDGPSHWRKLTNDLETVKASNDCAFNQSRISSTFPICCPRHNTTTMNINSTNIEFPNNQNWNKVFCKEICSSIPTTCHHPCGLPCHSPTLIPHTEQCKEKVRRPCNDHIELPLLCYEARGQYPTLQEGLNNFQCEVNVEYQRPECEHKVNISCFNSQEIIHGNSVLKECKEIVGDYIHPSCGHITKNPDCSTRRRYEENTPKCTVKVQHTRPCQCKQSMPCWESNQEKIHPSKCKASKEFTRPRCLHRVTMRCCEGENMHNQWKLKDGISASLHDPSKSIVLVKSSSRYGPSETTFTPLNANCAVNVMYQQDCGHLLSNVACHIAFDYSSKSKPAPNCIQEVSSITSGKINPLCSHSIKYPCWLQSHLDNWHPWLNEDPITIQSDTGIPMIHESILLQAMELYKTNNNVPLKEMKNLCDKEIIIQRICDSNHTLKVKCSEIFDILYNNSVIPKCTLKYDRILPCSHLVSVSCKTRHNTAPKCKEVLNAQWLHNCGHTKIIKLCHQFTEYQNNQNLQLCTEIIQTNRYRCGHQVSLQCCNRIQVEKAQVGIQFESNLVQVNQICLNSNERYCLQEDFAISCEELVSFERDCHHVVRDIKCHEGFLFASGMKQMESCEVLCVLSSPLCGHDIQVPCWATSLVAIEWNPWNDIRIPDFPSVIDTSATHTANIVSCPLVTYDSKKPTPFPMTNHLNKKILNCNFQMVYRRQCGHEIKLSCADALLSNISECKDNVAVICKDCNNETIISCHIHKSNIRKQVKNLCNHYVLLDCQICLINKVQIKCHQRTERVECKKQVTSLLPNCSHEVTWICGTDVDPRENTSYRCHRCIIPMWREYVETIKSLKAKENSVKSLISILTQQFNTKLQEELEIQDIIKIINHDELTQSRFIASQISIIESFVRVLSKLGQHIPNPPASPIISKAAISSATALVSEIKVDETINLLDNYHIVYTVITKTEGDKQKKKGKDQPNQPEMESNWTFAHQDSSYGRGYSIKRYEKPSDLDYLKTDEDGSICIVFGLANYQRVLPNMTELAIGKGSMNRANQKVKEYQNQGYDCLSKPRVDLQAKEMVYWTNGSVIPILSCRIKLKVQCGICFDSFIPIETICCTDQHYLCHDCCGSFIKAAKENDSVGKSVDTEGNLLCPKQNCKQHFDLFNIAKVIAGDRQKEIHDLLMELKLTIFKRKVETDTAQAAKLHYEKEIEMIRQMDEHTRSVELSAMHIKNNILSLQCPRCSMVFIDFEGCFALTCGNQRCRAGFCAWCLKDCGDDAHSHVANCPENDSRDVFGNFQTFDRHHVLRRKEKVKSYLQSLNPPNIRIDVFKRVQRELNDIGIRFEPHEFQVAARDVGEANPGNCIIS